jgi:hypothetical protein
MVSPRDSNIIELWLECQSSPHTRRCYRRDAGRLLAPARTLAAVKSPFGFCHRMRYVRANPAAELVRPCYEKRLAERIVGMNPHRWRIIDACGRGAWRRQLH